jgi:hypothetical protein
MESRGSDFYNANQLENDEAKRRVIPNLPRRPQPTFIEKTNNQTNPANTLDTSFQRRAYYRQSEMFFSRLIVRAVALTTVVAAANQYQ